MEHISVLLELSTPDVYDVRWDYHIQTYNIVTYTVPTLM